MAWLNASEITRILSTFRQTLPTTSLPTLLEEIAKLENAMVFSGFTGRNGAGACTLTGALVGDKVLGVVDVVNGGSDAASFETTITVVDEIQQTDAGDKSTNKYAVLLIRK